MGVPLAAIGILDHWQRTSQSDGMGVTRQVDVTATSREQSPGMPFGFIPDSAFGFAGIPTHNFRYPKRTSSSGGFSEIEMNSTSHEPRLFVTRRRETTTLNWNSEPEREFHLYADAFRNAAQKLLENDRLDRGFGLDDFDACPVVYLYRHALELLLKEILLGDGRYFLKFNSKPDPRSVVEKHSLTRFLPHVREIFSELGWGKSFDEIERVIKELAAVDPGSHSFRYPIKKDLTKSLSGPFRFSVREFARVMENVVRILSEACYALPEEYQARAEEAYEARIEELRYADHYEPDEGYWEE